MKEVTSLANIGMHQISSASEDLTVKVWDLNKFSSTSTFKGLKSTPKSLNYDLHLNYLSVGSE